MDNEIMPYRLKKTCPQIPEFTNTQFHTQEFSFEWLDRVVQVTPKTVGRLWVMQLVASQKLKESPYCSDTSCSIC